MVSRARFRFFIPSSCTCTVPVHCSGLESRDMKRKGLDSLRMIEVHHDDAPRNRCRDPHLDDAPRSAPSFHGPCALLPRMRSDGASRLGSPSPLNRGAMLMDGPNLILDLGQIREDARSGKLS